MAEETKTVPSCCASEAPQQKKPLDKLLWGSLLALAAGYAWFLSFGHSPAFPEPLNRFTHGVYDLVNTIWWTVILGIVMISLLGRIPREFVTAIMGRGGTVSGVFRATGAGVLLDLCNHGILMVGAKLYERGASAGQVMAFLLASPWNSFSVTLVLLALIGWQWTLAFIVLSMVVAILTGVLFDQLVKARVLPSNPNETDIPQNFSFWSEAKRGVSGADYSASTWRQTFIDGVKDSRMVLRWLFFGLALTALIRAVFPPDLFAAWFGPELLGLTLTLIAATVIEVCSEGSAPIAGDLLTRASAPGNAFTFLMAGVATDYTEVMVVKETTRSWKIALFLPLLTVPQIVLLGWVLNQAAL